MYDTANKEFHEQTLTLGDCEDQLSDVMFWPKRRQVCPVQLSFPDPSISKRTRVIFDEEYSV